MIWAAVLIVLLVGYVFLQPTGQAGSSSAKRLTTSIFTWNVAAI